MTKSNADYREQLFDAVSDVIEKVGQNDMAYRDSDKALDILDVLESLLAYTVFSTCLTTEQIRDSCEESYVNIKRLALRIYENSKNEKGLELVANSST